jgi:translation elongation factor EF-G
LNVGILVDIYRDKRTLAERVLHGAGIIDEIDRVDGKTQTVGICPTYPQRLRSE